MNQLKKIKSFFEKNKVKERFKDMLERQNVQPYIVDVLASVAKNRKLQECDPVSLYGAVLAAARLKLKINEQLGHAYLLPFNSYKQGGGKITAAQLIIGYKGYIQLAHRTRVYKKLNAIEIYKNEIKLFNRLQEEIVFNENFISNEKEIVAYAAYIKMNNGFEKIELWPKEKMIEHANKYCKLAMNNTQSVWNMNFNSMAKKTVLKHLLSKWGYLGEGGELQIAKTIDHAAIMPTQNGKLEVSYVENGSSKELDLNDFSHLEEEADDDVLHMNLDE